MVVKRRRKSSLHRILFVCTGNICRSPMAKFLLQDVAQRNGLDVETQSAGTAASYGEPATEEAIAVLQELGIDAKSHRSQPLSWELLDWADWVLTMTESQKRYILSIAPELKGKVFTLKEFVGEDGEIPDPYGTSRQAYRQTRDEIARLVQKLVEKLSNP